MSQFAITISKYCRGSLTSQEIIDVHQFFLKKFISTRLLIVNEHKNFKHEPFEHLHISLHMMGDMRTDNLNTLIKKNLSFLSHKKDVMVKQEISDGWKEYCSKSADRTIIEKIGITDQEIEQYNLDYKIKVQTVKDSKQIISKSRVPKGDLPYVMANFIQDNEIQYDFRLTTFSWILSRMLNEGYAFEMRNLVEVKAVLDNSLGNTSILLKFIEDQFKFIQYE